MVNMDIYMHTAEGLHVRLPVKVSMETLQFQAKKYRDKSVCQINKFQAWMILNKKNKLNKNVLLINQSLNCVS